LHQKHKLIVYINVEQNLQKLFKRASYEPESRLSDEVWGLIENKKRRITKWKVFGYSGLSILSLVGSVFSIKILVEQFIRLGFFDYLSLVFSDSSVITIYWKEYTLTLADSLPFASLGVSLFFLFLLFVFINRTSCQFKNRLLIA